MCNLCTSVYQDNRRHSCSVGCQVYDGTLSCFEFEVCRLGRDATQTASLSCKIGMNTVRVLGVGFCRFR